MINLCLVVVVGIVFFMLSILIHNYMLLWSLAFISFISYSVTNQSNIQWYKTFF